MNETAVKRVGVAMIAVIVAWITAADLLFDDPLGSVIGFVGTVGGAFAAVSLVGFVLLLRLPRSH